MKKKVLIENSFFEFEIFANYKYSYTVVECDKSIFKIKKVIVYSDGTAFGGVKNINKRKSNKNQ